MRRKPLWVLAVVSGGAFCVATLQAGGAALAARPWRFEVRAAGGLQRAAVMPAAAAAGSGADWGKAVAVPGLVKLNKGDGAETTSIACASAGDCSAGGVYTDGLGFDQPWVDTEKDGTWGGAVKVPGMAALNVGMPQFTGQVAPGVTSVSCAAAGECAAVGIYYDINDFPQLFVVSEKDGRWGRAEPMPGMIALKHGGPADVYQVSCGAAGDCGAVGFFGGDLGQTAFVVSEHRGTWGKAKVVPGIASVDGGSFSTLTSVSCPSAGNCTAGGSAGGGSGAFAVSEVRGTWRDAAGIKNPPAQPGTVGGITSVSCWSAENCVAVGTFNSFAYAMHESGGGWNVPEEVTSDLFEGALSSATGVSCGTSGDCTAIGDTSAPSSIAWGASVTGGTPGAPGKIPDISGALSCSPSGRCGLGGFTDTTSGSKAMVASGSGSAFGAAEELPGSADLSHGSAVVNAVSCAGKGCVAVGSYTDKAGSQQAFVTGSGGGQKQRSAAWGFDTASPASAKFLTSKPIASLGTPKFVGQYLEFSKDVHDVITAAIAAAIHRRHARVILLSSPKTPGGNLTTAKEAVSDADLAVAASRKLHVPDGVAIFRDVENNYHVTAAYVAAWVTAVEAHGYVPGFYENPKESGKTAFSTAYCRAAHEDPATSSRTVLFSDQPEISATSSKAESAAPAWNPASPSHCKSQTIAWQYLENPKKTAPNIDDDEALPDDFKYFW